MKNLRIKLFGKPQKGFSFMSTGNTNEDRQKYDKLKAKFAQERTDTTQNAEK